MDVNWRKVSRWADHYLEGIHMIGGIMRRLRRRDRDII